MVLRIKSGGGVSGAVRNKSFAKDGPLEGTISRQGVLRGRYAYDEGGVLRTYTTVAELRRASGELNGVARFYYQGRVIGTASVNLVLSEDSAPAPAATPKPRVPIPPAPGEESSEKDKLKNN